ncbi:MAG: right-handed parallel beta-helix repeat-containing protein, partial [Flavobacteriaceae bacterium]|nr:right-handed parallel beta-helix repeat-containing protein [Flavobacteriaceae bacterium]
MKRILTILGIMVCAIGFAQTFTATYDFEDVNGVTNPLTGTTDPTPPPTATGVTFGSFSAVGTPVNPNADNRFSFTDWATGATNGSNTFTGVLNTGEYYQVTITPATGYTVDLNSITFTMQRSGTGIRQYMVRSSIDGYTANLSASINPANADLSVVATNIFQVADASTSAENGSTITLGGASFTGLTSAVTFRFYALNAEAATGTFGIDNVVINGSASALVADYCIPGALGDATYRRVGKVTLTDSFTGDVFENESDIDGFTDTKPPYEDFTSLGPINLTTGSTGNTIAVKKAWRTAPDNDGTAAWIDFNGDKIFTLDERILNTQSNTNSVETATFNVPSTAVAGSLVRMRVMMRMNVNQDPPNPPNIPDPCWDFMFSQGQFEDYTVSINAPVATPKINVTASSGTATADYSTLKDAFDAINSGTHGGNIAVNVLESTTETATAVLNAGAYTSVIVKPAAGVTATISGDLADVPLVQFLGSNITIDGSNTAGGTTRDLTFNNTAVGGFFPMSQVVQFGSTSTTRTDNINLKNAEFIATDTNAYAIMFSDASSLGGDAYFKNVMMDNISVQNSYLGVYAWAATAPGVNGSLTIKNSDFTAMSSEAILALGVDGLVIDNNNIGNFVPNSEPKIGMMLGMNTINASITNNTISDISGTAEITGINVSSGHADANYTISGNTISNLEADYFSYISGIRVTGTNSNPTGDISIINNKITGINNISTSGYGAHAITLDPKNTSGTISIINNFIADVTGVGYSGGWGIFDNGYGMFLGSGSGYKIYNNTVNLATDQSSGGNMAAMNIGTGIAAGAIDLRNNIFVTTQTTGTRYAIYSASPNTAFSNIDNNDYYSAGPNLGFIGTARATLADIQTGFGGNTNSANILPVFTSGTDLHLDPATNTTLDNLGTPLADVTTDIDGETRDVATPDMGADEFGVLAAKIHVTATSGTATADYDTLKEAFDAINAGTHAGDIEVSVLESTTETATAVLNASGTGSSNYTNVVVKPAAGVTATIDGNISTAGATSMVQILGSHVTIDGSNTTGGTTRDLTFQQTITTPLCVFGINSTATSAPDDINIKNVTIVQGGGGYGIMALTDALAAGNFSNVTIDNIAVKNAGFGIFAQALPAPGVNTNFTVKNSDFSATGTDAIKVMGIYVQGVDGATIDNNTIGNFDSLNYATPNNFKRPIWIATGNLNVNITNNTISDITGSATAVSGILTNGNTTISGNTFSNLSSSVAGNNQAIFVNNTFANVSVVNNEITNIKNVSTTGWGAHGIYLAATNTTGNINVFNNFISDVTGYGYSFGFGVSDNGYGIFIASGTGYKIYNNTVSMNTNQPTNGNAAAINIASGVNTNGAVDLRNNIFSNTQTAGATRYAIYSGATAARYSNIDYNDYYSPAALGFIGGSARATLADIQTGFGGNTNSADILPVFTSATDLHLDGPTNATLDNLGTPLAEVTTDIDGDTRSTTTPDMGADEFGTPVAVSGCLSDPYGEYPHSIYTPVCNGVVGVIVPDGWAGEYSTVAVTAGTEYTFASSIAT